MTPRPPRSTLFPYTTLFRSGDVGRPVTTSQHSVERLFDPVRFQRKAEGVPEHHRGAENRDRKSTRLNSSHLGISYAVFCLKKKKKNQQKRQNGDRVNLWRIC